MPARVIEPPTKQLLETLLTLKLCTRRDLSRCRGRVRQLARDLPAFDFVWIDSLLHARKLTPFQARLLEASEFEQLSVGPCVLIDRLGKGKHSTTFLARRRDGQERLVLKRVDSAAELLAARLQSLNELISDFNGFQHPNVVVPHATLQHQDQLVILSRYRSGPRLSELLVRRGRFPAAVVLEIARQLVDGLGALEEKGRVHGDIRSPNVLLTSKGNAVLVDSGIGPVVAPVLSIHEDLTPERYDGIAPELIGTGQSASTQSEIYALGCLLWQLLAGRPPFPTSDPLAKLAAHQTREVADVREWAPDTPAPLAEAIQLFTQKDPQQRPRSFEEIRTKWGVPGHMSRHRLAKFRGLFNTAVPRIPMTISSEPSRRWPLTAALLLVLCGSVLFLVDQGARTQLLSWSKGTLDLVKEEGNSLSTQIARVDKPLPAFRTLPKPNAEGLILLDSSGPYRAETLNSVGPLTIRGPEGASAIIEVSGKSFRLNAERVLFENIHFRPTIDAGASAVLEQRLLSVRSQHLALLRCSFESDSFAFSRDASQRAAILWGSVAPDDPAGSRVSLRDTVFSGDMAAIQFANSPTDVRMVNCLKQGNGALLAFASAPRSGRQLQIGLEQMTMRESGEIIRVSLPKNPDSTGRLTLNAVNCIFHLVGSRDPLFRFFSGSRSSAWLGRFKMTESGSVISPGQTIAVWQHPELIKSKEIDSSQILPPGISVGEFEFLGPLGRSPKNSELKTLSAPRKSLQLPGIDASTLKVLPEPADLLSGQSSRETSG